MDSTTVTSPVVTELRAAAGLIAQAAGSLPAVWQLPDAEVESGLSALLRLQAQAAAVQAVLLAEAESRDLKAATGAPSLPRWLGDRWRLSRADAGARLRQAAALRRHPVLLDALAAGAVTVEQAEVLAAVLHQVAGLPGLDPGTDGDSGGAEGGEAAAAAEFLIGQCATLTPRELARAGQAVVEALTRAPSADDPAEEAALARDHARAERELQERERNWLSVTHRPGGRVRIGAQLGPAGTAAFLAWCRQVDPPATGVDGFEDTRSRSERRGDALADLLTTSSRTTSASKPSDATPADGDAGDDADEVSVDSDAERDPPLGMPGCPAPAAGWCST